MKKLIMMATVALVAIGANAATITWGATKGYIYDGLSENKLTSGTAYLMIVTSGYTQGDLVSDFLAADGNAAATLDAMSSSGALATGTGAVGSNGRIAAATSTYTMTADETAYFVIFNGDKMYVSQAGDAVYDSLTAEASLSFASSSTSSKLEFDAASGYSAAGWYTASAVPEPTSGLLLLLGVAGLALRRRRA